jgi:hypothetical protein
MMRTFRSIAIAVGILAVAVNPAAADLYVLQIGDGTAGQTTTPIAAPLIIKKFADTGGSPTATVAMPIAAGAGTVPNPITTRGNSTTESFMHLSTNGQFLVMGGYAVTPNTASPDATTAARVVGRVAINNFTSTGIDTTTALTDAYMNGTNSFRSVASTDGTNFWLGGTGDASASGIRYTTLGSTTSTQLSSTPTNARVANIFNDATNQPQLFLGSGSSPFVGVSTVGTGLPTTTGQTTTLLTSPLAPPTGDGSTNPMDFWFKDANTLYKANGTNAADPGRGIAKWAFEAGSWVYKYTIDPGVPIANGGSGPIGAGGITGTVEGGNTVLYATNYNRELVKIIDTGAASVATLLAIAPTNTTFRGIAFVSTGVLGDFNQNNKVDAADYATWRKNEIANAALPNDNGVGNQAARYTLWRQNFGNPGSGAGLGAEVIPEPGSLVLLLIGALPLCLRRRAT